MLVPKQILTSLLTRLDNQLAELLGTKVSETMNDEGYEQQASSALETIEEVCAREDSYHSLDGLLNNIFHDRLNAVLATEGRVIPNLPSDQGRVTRYFKELQSNFTSASTPKHPTPGEGDLYGHDPDIMQIWYILGNIYISLPLGMFPEHVWDQFMADFGSIVSLAENYINRSRFVLIHSKIQK
jgi:hypothetical protein